MKAAIVVFAKAPQPGHVKTRLQPELSAEEAALFYEASLCDVVRRLEGISPEIRIAYDPAPSAAEYFASQFSLLRREPQVTGDLGERLAASFDALFRDGFETAAIIGTDSPTLPVEYLDSALAALSEVDAAFGPTADGGYYLVGLARRSWPASRTLFHGIPWSTEDVLRTSLLRADQTQLSYRLLPAWYDIDKPTDLVRAERDAAPGSHLARWFQARKRAPSPDDA
ncbi:MAG: DUF2064 domain-containing protein [Gemmatimonas sp.]|nr:DUF2064 domain-containing protein [Gemmatimonas sp.]